MDTTGSQCFPSHRSLAERTGLSRRAVCAHLGLAVDLKWISRGRREGASGQGWRRNEYRATLPKVLTQGKHVAEEGDEPDDIKVGNEVQHVTPEGGERGSARPAEGGEPDDIKVGNQVPTNQSKNQPNTNTSKSSAPVKDMWRIWLKELGGDPPQPKLDDERQKKLRLLWDEQLRDQDNPLTVFRKILHAIKASEFHMAKRAFQMPESTFRNANIRETWANEASTNSRPRSHHMTAAEVKEWAGE